MANNMSGNGAQLIYVDASALRTHQGLLQHGGVPVTIGPDGSIVKLIEANDQNDTQNKEVDESPEINIDINNVVCSFSTRCHLNLKKIAMESSNVIYKRENGMVNMKLRNPYVTASIWSSGKITCTGATSEEASKIAARRVSRVLQKLGFRVRFSKFRVVNVLGTCSVPWGIRITHFSQKHKEEACYEPELHPGVTYRIKDPKATLKIFSTGSITVTAPSVNNVEAAIQHIYPLVLPFKMEKANVDKRTADYTRQFVGGGKRPPRPPPRPYKRAKLDDSDESSDLESDYDDGLDSGEESD